MARAADLLTEIRALVSAHAAPNSQTAIDGVLASRVTTSEPDYQLTQPLLVVMAQGGKRLYLGERAIEYHAGQCLLVTAGVPLSGHFIRATDARPALAVGLRLRPSAIAELLSALPAPARRSQIGLRPVAEPAIATAHADAVLLDAVARTLRLLEHPADIPVLAPMFEREILWRLLTSPLGPRVAQIGIADSSLAHVSRVITRIRENFAEPISIKELADLAGMSVSTFHRHFRGTTGMTPLEFQKHLRLQEARSLLIAGSGDVADIAFLVGYSSATQFNREYRRLFGSPPGRDATRLRARHDPRPIG